MTKFWGRVVKTILHTWGKVLGKLPYNFLSKIMSLTQPELEITRGKSKHTEGMIFF